MNDTADGHRSELGSDDSGNRVPGRRGHRFFAALYARGADRMEAGVIGRMRRDLVVQATGHVVDLGAGVGLNLPHLGEDVETIHLVEPDPFMVRRLRAAIPGADQTRGRTQIADARRVPPRSVVHEMGAETLPFADASIDTVLATLTLCTVDDLEVSAQEIRRVLRPGGSLLVLEHVRSLDLRTAVWQERWKKPWRWAGGGCNLDRETGEALAEAGFETSDLRRVTLPGLPLVGEVLTGHLIAP